MKSDERDYRERLIALQSHCEGLMTMYDRRGSLRRGARAQVRSMYEELRKEFGAEHRRVSDMRSPSTFNDPSRWYRKAIYDAVNHLHARVTASPDLWFSCVYDAREDVTYALGRMKASSAL